MVSIDSYEFQPELTLMLDKQTDNFDECVLNLIVLWKVNRYPTISEETIRCLNKIGNRYSGFSLKKEDDKQLARDTIKALLNSKGVKLPMASTILRFRNPLCFQIFDERVCRVIYGQPSKTVIDCFKCKTGKKGITAEIDFYFEKYLAKLTETCASLGIKFDQSDRILWLTDKSINKNINLQGNLKKRAT